MIMAVLMMMMENLLKCLVMIIMLLISVMIENLVKSLMMVIMLLISVMMTNMPKMNWGFGENVRNVIINIFVLFNMLKTLFVIILAMRIILKNNNSHDVVRN